MCIPTLKLIDKKYRGLLPVSQLMSELSSNMKYYRFLSMPYRVDIDVDKVEFALNIRLTDEANDSTIQYGMLIDGYRFKPENIEIGIIEMKHKLMGYERASLFW